jgi:hypothetical protein
VAEAADIDRTSNFSSQLRNNSMKVLYSDEKPFKNGLSIFLAGPTPRSTEVTSWRREAISMLSQLGFEGTVLVPERRDWSVKFDYTDQVEWEHAGLSNATLILFWVPREMKTMPALTTNVEFGLWLKGTPEKVIYGRPDNAASVRYLDWLYRKITRRKVRNTLEETLRAALKHSKTLKSAKKRASR